MKPTKPSSSSRASASCRLARTVERTGLFGTSAASGGLFVDRAEALRFAMFENGNRPHAVIMVPGIFELDMDRKPSTAPQLSRDINAHKRRAA